VAFCGGDAGDDIGGAEVAVEVLSGVDSGILASTGNGWGASIFGTSGFGECAGSVGTDSGAESAGGC